MVQVNEGCSEYFIVRNACDVRPYRLLIQEQKNNFLDLVNVTNLEREFVMDDEQKNYQILLGREGAFKAHSILIGLFCKSEEETPAELLKVVGPTLR